MCSFVKIMKVDRGPKKVSLSASWTDNDTC